nr:hypothetical protein [uncultured Cellulosilyticum sp.]
MKQYQDAKKQILFNRKQKLGILVVILLSIAIVICIGILVYKG